MQTYIFKVKLAFQKRVYREIEMQENQTLDDLHYAIFDAFDFEEMHLYSFFMSGKAWDNTTEYAPNYPGRDSRDVSVSSKKIKIKDLNFRPKQKFLYLFDYGDSWEFEVEFVGNGEAEEKAKYPRIIGKAGESPSQYPDEDDDEDDEDKK